MNKLIRPSVRIDRDLATGNVTDRPRDEFTYASWLIQYIEIGASMASAFESKDIMSKVSSSQAYQAFLQADKQLEAMLTNLPSWLKADGPTAGMPDSVDPNHLRSTFLISLQHKILSIHRPFLAKPSRGECCSTLRFFDRLTTLTKQFEQLPPSRSRIVESSTPHGRFSARQRGYAVSEFGQFSTSACSNSSHMSASCSAL